MKTTVILIAAATVAAGGLAQAQAPASPAGAPKPPAVRQEAPPPQRAGLFWEEKWRENANGSAEAPRVDLKTLVRTRLPVLQDAARQISQALSRYPALAHSILTDN